jgi:hypothetical protein
MGSHPLSAPRNDAMATPEAHEDQWGRPDIAILRDALANHSVTDSAERRELNQTLLGLVRNDPSRKCRIEAARAFAYVDSVNQRREAKLLDILCDRSRDPLPNPAPAAQTNSQTVIGQVNVIAAGDQPASDPMSGLMRLIRSGLPMPQPAAEPIPPGTSAPITSPGDKPEGGQRGLVPSVDDGAVPDGQLGTPSPADRPDMPAVENPFLERIRKNGANGK